MKKVITSFFRKRYIDIPPVNMWRICTIIPCVFGMLWVLGVIAETLGKLNIRFAPELWFALCILAMASAFKAGRVISDSLQVAWEQRCEKKINGKDDV